VEAPRSIERVESIETLLPPRPERPHKTVSNSGIPNICVGLLSELAAVAGDESEVIAEVVVDTNVKPLCIFCWQAIAATVQGVKLLHAGYELNAAEKGGCYVNLRELVGGLDPIPRRRKNCDQIQPSGQEGAFPVARRRRYRSY
jgi:hypothetical protein